MADYVQHSAGVGGGDVANTRRYVGILKFKEK